MRWRLPILFFLSSPLATLADQSGHVHTAAHSSESSVYTVAQPHEAQGVYTPDLTQEAAYSYPQSDYTQTSAYGNVNYDPSAYSNYYDYSLEQSNEVDDIAEKQGIPGIPNPAAFIPFFASFSLPLGAAVATFMAIVAVSAAFFLFPSEVEVEVNSTRNGSVRDSDDEGRFSWFGLRKRRSVDSQIGGNLGARFCSNSSSTLCKLLSTVLISTECLEAASCEVSKLGHSGDFPVMSKIVEPFLSSRYYDRFSNMDCSKLRCSLQTSPNEL